MATGIKQPLSLAFVFFRQKACVHMHVHAYIRTRLVRTMLPVLCIVKGNSMVFYHEYSSRFQKKISTRYSFAVFLLNHNQNYDVIYDQHLFCVQISVYVVRVLKDAYLQPVKKQKPQQVPSSKFQRTSISLLFSLSGCECVRVKIHVRGFYIRVSAHIWTRLFLSSDVTVYKDTTQHQLCFVNTLHWFLSLLLYLSLSLSIKSAAFCFFRLLLLCVLSTEISGK